MILLLQYSHWHELIDVRHVHNDDADEDER